MLEEFINSPIAYGIAGGALFAATFAGKAYYDGETLEASKFGLTVVLGGLLGLLFEIVGFNPNPEQWYLILFAFAGLVAEIEVILKLLVNGHYEEARSRRDSLEAAAQEGARKTLDEMDVEQRVRDYHGDVRDQIPDEYGPHPDDNLREIYDDVTGDLDDTVEDDEVDDGRRNFLGLGFGADDSADEDDDNDGDGNGERVVTEGA